MIRLARHIEILLLGNECVIVPNLGGFVEHHVCARYDESEGLFLPPLRTLGFNPLLNMNDSLLAQSYVEAYDLSYPEAVEAIEDEVRELLKIMGNSGSYELTNIGRLYYDMEGKMNFEPCESGVLTPEFYALSSFEMPLLSAKPAVDAVPVTDETEDDDDNHAKVIYIGDEHGQRTLNISLKAIRNVSVAAVVLVTALFVSFPLFHGQNMLGDGRVESGFYEMFFPHKSDAPAQKTATPFKSTTGKPSAKPVNKTTAPTENVKDVKAQDVTTNAETTDKATATPSQYWSIVVCSHVSKQNAEILTEKLKKEGYGDAFMSTTGATKVLFGKFKTKEEAHNRLNELTNKDTFKDSWLLEVKE